MDLLSFVAKEEGAQQARPTTGAGKCGARRTHGHRLPRRADPASTASASGRSAACTRGNPTPSIRCTSPCSGATSPAPGRGCGRCRQCTGGFLAMARHAHQLDGARREGVRGVRAEDRRERLPHHACLPRWRPIQPIVPRVQPAGHAFLRRLRRFAVHAARLLCLEERAALLLFDGGDAARVFQGHPLHRARQRHRQPPRSGRCRDRRPQGHPAHRRGHLLGPLPLSAQCHGQAAARPLSRQDRARHHQARHRHLRSQRPRRRGLQGDRGRPHPLHRHPPRQLAHPRHLRQGLHPLLAGHGRRLQALAPAEAGGRHAARRWQLSWRPHRARPRQGHRRLVGRAVLRHREGARQGLERGQVRARGRDARILRLCAPPPRQRRLQVQSPR